METFSRDNGAERGKESKRGIEWTEVRRNRRTEGKGAEASRLGRTGTEERKKANRTILIAYKGYC